MSHYRVSITIDDYSGDWGGHSRSEKVIVEAADADQAREIACEGSGGDLVIQDYACQRVRLRANGTYA